jgi:hypothetical protein
MDDEVLRREKIRFIKEEIKKFAVAKRKCKYAYKNWFRIPKLGPCNSMCGSPYDSWNSPSFDDLDGNRYNALYGKFYITCLHIVYNKLRNKESKISHMARGDDSVYKDGETIIHAWISEKIAHQRYC